MCTVSWLRDIPREGYEIVANRDEHRSRRPALPPRVLPVGERRVLTPIDGDAGGSWIGVNDCGLAVCLLNGPLLPGSAEGRRYQSRGRLVLELLARPGVAAALEGLGSMPLGIYRPFRLLLVERSHRAVARSWDSQALVSDALEEPPLPLVSSSRDPEGARRERHAAWRRRVGEGRWPARAELLAYHRSHEPARGPWSVCMHREDARTVSSSHLVVGATKAVFRYAPGPPCRTPWQDVATLDLLPLARGDGT